MSKKNTSKVLGFPSRGATLSPARPSPEPRAVESQAPKKKKGKVLEIVPKVIRDEEIRELVELHEQMKSAVEKYLERDRWIGSALLAGATVEGDKERTEMVRAFVMTYKKSKPNPTLLERLKPAVLENL